MGFPVLVMAMSATLRDPIGLTFLAGRTAARRPAILDGLQDFCIIATTKSISLAEVVGGGNGNGNGMASLTGVVYGHSNRFVPSALAHRASSSSRSWWEGAVPSRVLYRYLCTPYIPHQAKL